jgi:hypothetical protein
MADLDLGGGVKVYNIPDDRVPALMGQEVKKNRGREHCEYKDKCDCYSEDSTTCTNSTSDERQDCGVYGRKCDEEPFLKWVSRGIENLVGNLFSPR